MDLQSHEVTVTFPRGDDQKPLKIIVTDKVLGNGFFGRVRVGLDRSNKNQVYAVKVIEEGMIGRRNSMLIHQNEIQIVSTIDSPNVISIKAIMKYGDLFYIPMEFCNGGDLSNYLTLKGGYLQEAEATFVLG
jgi:serine/threonine-protein kinase ULK/ATG1